MLARDSGRALICPFCTFLGPGYSGDTRAGLCKDWSSTQRLSISGVFLSLRLMLSFRQTQVPDLSVHAQVCALMTVAASQLGSGNEWTGSESTAVGTGHLR